MVQRRRIGGTGFSACPGPERSGASGIRRAIQAMSRTTGGGIKGEAPASVFGGADPALLGLNPGLQDPKELMAIQCPLLLWRLEPERNSYAPAFLIEN